MNRVAFVSPFLILASVSCAQVLLQTGFEPAQGFVAGPLDGQGGWSDNTAAGTISDTFSLGGVQSAVVPLNEAGLSGAFGPGFSFDPLSTTNQWLRIEWSQFSRFLNRRAGADTATTVGFEIRSGSQLVAGVKVFDGTEVVCVYDASLPGYVETNAVAPRESWVGFQLFLDPVNHRVTYAMERTILSQNVVAGTSFGPLDSFKFVLTDTGFEHLYVDDISIRAVAPRTLAMQTTSSIAPDLANVPHGVKFQNPSTGEVLLLTTVTPTTVIPFAVSMPDVTVPVTARIKPRGHLSRLVRNILPTSTAQQLLTQTYIAGDITNDDIIDVADYSELARDFDMTAIDPLWYTPRANGVRPADSDVTRDGLVDISDYSQLVYAFDLAGELP